MQLAMSRSSVVADSRRRCTIGSRSCAGSLQSGISLVAASTGGTAIVVVVPTKWASGRRRRTVGRCGAGSLVGLTLYLPEGQRRSMSAALLRPSCNRVWSAGRTQLRCDIEEGMLRPTVSGLARPLSSEFQKLPIVQLFDSWAISI